MDFKKTAIIAGLAITGYLLLLQWNSDYNQAPTAKTEPASSAHVAQGDLPSAPVVTTAIDDSSDIPQVLEANVAPIAETSASTSTRLIKIATDTLQLSIDPVGGDVVRAALPMFPEHKDTPEIPFVLLDTKTRTYVAQSGLITAKGGRPTYASASSSYVMKDSDDQLVVDLVSSEAGLQITKRFTLNRGDYAVHVDYLINNQSQDTFSANFYGQLKRDNSGDPSSQGSATSFSTYLGAAVFQSEKEKYHKLSFGDFKDSPYKQSNVGGYAAVLQHYFVSAWVPAVDATHQYSTRSIKGNNIIGFVDEKISAASGQQVSTGAILYMGPKDQGYLAELSPGLELTVDYGILWFIAQPLFALLTFIQSIVGNWGLTIIILTIIVKAIFYPLSAASYRSMANMRKVAPKLARMKEEFGDDRQKMSQAMMELYKKEKINPLGGCLPILVQMPVFIALYWTLLESVELRQAPFMLWINDLSQMDPYFILPLIMGASMFIQQQLNPTPPDPMQARVMKMMPIMFTFFFLWFPAGLVLYWVVNNVLSILQQWSITRKIEAAG